MRREIQGAGSPLLRFPNRNVAGNPSGSKITRDGFALGFALCRVGRAGNIGSGQAECPLGLFEHPRISRPHPQLHAFAPSVHQDAERCDSTIGLAIGRNQVRRRVFGSSLIRHILDRGLIVGPAGAVAKILVGQFSALHWIGQAVAKTTQLLVPGDVQEQFDEANAGIHEHTLEFDNLPVGTSPFVHGGKPFDPSDQNAVGAEAIFFEQSVTTWSSCCAGSVATAPERSQRSRFWGAHG